MALQPYEAYEMARILLQRIGIIHDLCNNAAYFLMDIDPNSVTWNVGLQDYVGSQLQIDHGSGLEDSTIADIKNLANNCYQGALSYRTNINSFVDNYPAPSDIGDALTLWGTTGAAMKTQMQTMVNAFTTARNAAIAASTKAELLSIGQSFLTAVPKLKLVRDFI